MKFTDVYTATDALTGVLVLVTIFYAWATFQILKANKGVVLLMREQMEQLNRPYVQVAMFIRPGTSLLQLRIQNTGRTAAENLRLEMDKDFFQFGERRDNGNLKLKSAFVNTISSFPPNSVIEFALGMGHSIFGDGASESTTPHQFAVKARYSFVGRTVCETTEIDLSPYLSSETPQDATLNGLHEVRDAIQSLTKQLEK